MHPFENMAMGIAMHSNMDPKMGSRLDLSGFFPLGTFLTMEPFENMAMDIAMDSKMDFKMDSKRHLSGFSLSALF